jgi:hypothetical protein
MCPHRRQGGEGKRHRDPNVQGDKVKLIGRWQLIHPAGQADTSVVHQNLTAKPAG